MGQNKHPMKIAMVSVFVEDPVKAFQYYTEILGFEEELYSLGLPVISFSSDDILETVNELKKKN